MKSMPNQTSLTGAAGEYYVMCRLLEMGYIAGLAPQGAPNLDIIATDIKGKKSVAIQIKTRRQKGQDNGWHMSQKHENLIGNNLYYCFIDLSDNFKELSATYIIPSKVVSEVLRDMHKLWLSIPGKSGRTHKDNKMRRLLPDYSKTLKTSHPLIKKYSLGWLDKYKENWKSLKLD